jgi:GTP-dependent phosphoenolpyruvate carboxykinase
VDESVLLRLDKAELEREADRHEEIMKSFGKAPEFMVENLAKFRERIAKM